MKKFFALLMVLVMTVSLFAACGKKTEAPAEDPTIESTTEATQPQAAAPGSALEILETVWNSYGEDEKFPVFGGNQNENANMEGPAAFDITDTDGLTGLLLVPAEQAANIDGAASMVHMMNSNNFTCGVFHVKGDVKAFADAMKAAINGNRWMCGMPEKMLITVIGGEYVLVSFGVNDAMTPFQAKVAAAYSDANQLYFEDLA